MSKEEILQLKRENEKLIKEIVGLKSELILNKAYIESFKNVFKKFIDRLEENNVDEKIILESYTVLLNQYSSH